MPEEYDPTKGKVDYRHLSDLLLSLPLNQQNCSNSSSQTFSQTDFYSWTCYHPCFYSYSWMNPSPYYCSSSASFQPVSPSCHSHSSSLCLSPHSHCSGFDEEELPCHLVEPLIHPCCQFYGDRQPRRQTQDRPEVDLQYTLAFRVGIVKFCVNCQKQNKKRQFA